LLQNGRDSIAFHSHILSQTPLEVLLRELEEEEARATEGNDLDVNKIATPVIE